MKPYNAGVDFNSQNRIFLSFSSSSVNKFTYENDDVATNIEMHKPVAKVDSGIEQDAPPKGKFSIHSKFNSNSPQKYNSSLPNYKSIETKSNLSYFSGNCEDSSRRHSNMTYGFNSQKGWTPILSNVNEQRNYSASRKEGPALSCSIGK